MSSISITGDRNRWVLVVCLASILLGWSVVALPAAWFMAAILLVACVPVVVSALSKLVNERALLISLLVFSFALTGLRQDVGIMVLEPWQIIGACCLSSWLFT